MKEFIRLPPLSPPIQTSINPEDQPEPLSVLTVVEQARQKAGAEEESKLQDLLSNDIEDLIDFSNDFQNVPIQGPATDIHGLQNLGGLGGLLVPQQTEPGTIDKAESVIPDKRAVFDEIPERKQQQSPQLGSQPQTPDLSMPDVDAQRQVAAKMFKAEPPESPRIALQFLAPHLGLASVDTQSMVSG